MQIYQNEYTTLYEGNALELLKNLDDNSIDVIITDPPYFLSNDGISCHAGKMVSVNKGDWDKTHDSMTIEEFYRTFLEECKRILKKDGNLWVFGSMHNIFELGYLLKTLKFKILNNITWEKPNPPPNLSCRMFTHSTETILWARHNEKSKHYFNYKLMKEINGNKQMKDVWRFTSTKPSEKNHGKHPTQKPLDLIKQMILASTIEDDLILDCFSGSGTTLVAAQELKRKSIGFEMIREYNEIAIKRLNESILNAKGE